MKRNLLIKSLGTAVLVASVGITGCNIRVSSDDEKKDKSDSSCQTEEEEDLCGCYSCPDEEDEDLCYCSSCVYDEDGEYISTNGAINDQFVYMTAVPDWDRINWDCYEAEYISDLTVIENDDLRLIAEEYSDSGYNIVDPVQDQEYGMALGDGEYMFMDGFSGEILTEHSSEFIHAYKMNEELFEYYLVCPYAPSDLESEDDGTVIRYAAEDGTYMSWYNRDTRIGFIYYGCHF